MNALTPSAQEELDRYFEETRPRLVMAGADPDEVIDDLRRRLQEELAGRAPASVGPGELRALLARFGPIDPPAPTPAALPPVPRSGWGGFRTACFVVFGVVLPIVTVGTELLAGWSAQDFLDPMPTFVHMMLCLLVPAGQLYAWGAVRGGSAPRWDAFAVNGLVVGISLFYSILFLPFVPIGLIALVFIVGLLPLTPHISLATALLLHRGLRKRAAGQPMLAPFLGGLLLALLTLVGLDVPKTVTRIAAARIASGNAADRQEALRLLRALGSEETLLRMCYVRLGMGTDALGAVLFPAVSTGQARETFFRMTGRPFNTVPPPDLRTLRGRTIGADEWDFEQGGAEVGQVRKGLSLVASSVDGSLDAAAATGYVEWTLEFRNDSQRPAEARAQLALPPGAVVSRVTLWISGEEREAAFAGRAQVRRAYEAVVRQRRDPVLVTTAGKDRVLVQCFPVPPLGGTMKTRLGLTVPLDVPALDRARLVLPRITERNFRIRPELRHAVWIEATGALSGAGVASETRADGASTWRGSWSDRELTDHAPIVSVSRPAVVDVWAADERTGQAPGVVRQRLEMRPRAASRLVIVIDASVGVEAHAAGIAAALTRAPADAIASILVAGDDVQRFHDPAGRGGSWADQLRRVRFVGGQDNVPALEAAWDEADRLHGIVVWIHGPQPVTLSPVDGLRQRWQRRPEGPTLLAFPLGTGPNRVLEALDDVGALAVVPREGPAQDDLARVFDDRGRPGAVYTAVRERRAQAIPPVATPGKTSDHLVRLWAHDEVLRLLPRGDAKPDEAIAIATRYQLVTPVSGAVVLETAAQYEQAGLTPATAGEVPTIPEPETWALIALALLVVAYGATRWRTAWTRGA